MDPGVVAALFYVGVTFLLIAGMMVVSGYHQAEAYELFPRAIVMFLWPVFAPVLAVWGLCALLYSLGERVRKARVRAQEQEQRREALSQEMERAYKEHYWWQK